MSRTTLLILMLCFLAYTVFRAVVYFRSKRPHFGIAVLFVSCVVLYEIVRLILQLTSEPA